MLPPAHRLRRANDFSSVVRRGRRVGGRVIVVHQDAPPAAEAPGAVSGAESSPALVGFVVSRAVGGSVVRNAVSRRLRAQVQHRLTALPANSRTVVRALPASAGASSEQLGQALDRALRRLGNERNSPTGSGA